jgi:hypothetical protein
MKIERGTCYAIETSYGDARGSWFIYWRARDSITGFTECHRFETRADGMHLMNPGEPVVTSLLESLTPIAESDWLSAWMTWFNSVSEPWNVE